MFVTDGRTEKLFIIGLPPIICGALINLRIFYQQLYIVYYYINCKSLKFEFMYLLRKKNSQSPDTLYLAWWLVATTYQLLIRGHRLRFLFLALFDPNELTLMSRLEGRRV